MREAVVSLDDADLSDLGIADLVSAFAAAGIEEFEELACDWDGAVIQVEVATRPDEERIRELPYVDRLERVAADETYLYLVGFTAPEIAGEMDDVADDLVGGCNVELTEEGAKFALVGPQEAIRDTIERYRDAGVTPDLRRFGEYEKDRGPLSDLTERQREVLETAYELGYYDVPREATAEDVAARFDVDDSTVVEHLQRAERNLLTRHLSTSVS